MEHYGNLMIGRYKEKIFVVIENEGNKQIFSGIIQSMSLSLLEGKYHIRVSVRNRDKDDYIRVGPNTTVTTVHPETILYNNTVMIVEGGCEVIGLPS